MGGIRRETEKGEREMSILPLVLARLGRKKGRWESKRSGWRTGGSISPKLSRDNGGREGEK